MMSIAKHITTSPTPKKQQKKNVLKLASSNLAASEIAEYYDERIADRFREMMHIVNFGQEPSFRKL